MNQYLLSTYAVDGKVPGAPSTPEGMQTFMERVAVVEAEMETSGAFVFSGGLQLHGPDAVTVARLNDDKVTMTDGPFAESKTQIAGFYIIRAEDLDAARTWAHKIADATRHPIEVRPFQATGLVKDFVSPSGEMTDPT